MTYFLQVRVPFKGKGLAVSNRINRKTKKFNLLLEVSAKISPKRELKERTFAAEISTNHLITLNFYSFEY